MSCHGCSIVLEVSLLPFERPTALACEPVSYRLACWCELYAP